ncbi:MYXO-CTERM sorting domain-containing protein [Microbacterium tumbae]
MTARAGRGGRAGVLPLVLHAVMLAAMVVEMAASHAPAAVLMAGAAMLAVAAGAAVAARRGHGCEAVVVDAVAMLAIVFLPAVGGGHHSAIGMPLMLPAAVVLVAWLFARRAVAVRTATGGFRLEGLLAGILVLAMLAMQLLPH